MPKAAVTKKTKKQQKLEQDNAELWSSLVKQIETPEKPYKFSDEYKEGELISHKTFGTGIVKEEQSNKIVVLFEDKERLMVHAMAK